MDRDESPINAIVSVLMLREGWDVQNVTVVVGLRPYTAKANILPEQAIGRGLRLMFRDLTPDYTEHVDIIGNQKFLDFVDDLEKLEDLQLDTFEIGKDKLRILTIMPLEERKEFDIGMPVLTPILVRKKSLADEIATLDVMTFQTMLLPLTPDDPNNKTFRYEGHDIITLQKIIERDYKVPEPQTAQELIGYYARRIAEAVKLPSQFAALAPKVREFFENKAFGRWVDLNDMVTVRAMSTQVASYVCIQEFSRRLKADEHRGSGAGTGDGSAHAFKLSALSMVAKGLRSRTLCLQHGAVRQRFREKLSRAFWIRRMTSAAFRQIAATVRVLD